MRDDFPYSKRQALRGTISPFAGWRYRDRSAAGEARGGRDEGEVIPNGHLTREGYGHKRQAVSGRFTTGGEA